MNHTPENTYTDRELDRMFKDFHDKLDLIVDQTTKTNGRIRKLEVWRAGIVGGLVVLGAMSFPNLSAVAKVFAGI